MTRFVLLDRDGTINVEREYLCDPGQMELLPHAACGLRAMRRMGLGLIVITNQSGIGRGFFDEACLFAVHERLRQLLRAEDVELDGIYICPHLPEDSCRCRKPRPGLVEQAARDFGFDPRDTFVIGDKPSEIELGLAVGATTILVRTGYGTETERNNVTHAAHVVADLAAAAAVVEQVVGPVGQVSQPARYETG